MGSKRNITYKCPYCDKRFNKENLVIHVGNKHDEMIPEKYSAFRLIFDYVNKKPSGYNGKCIICGNESGWDEEKGKYNRLCSNPACKKKYIQSFEERMIRSKGVKRISSTAEGQAKMLANRKISGEYKFQDGGIKTYTGTYEKKALEFMDKVMNIKSEDISTPGPIMEYMFEGKKHIYISDIYYVPYNLIIEVKDGGDNPNNRSMPEYRAKQIAKEKYIIKETDFNYLRLTNNDFSQLLAVFMELKMEMSNDTPERIIRINEGFSRIKDQKRIQIYNKMMNITKNVLFSMKSELKNGFKLANNDNFDKDIFFYKEEDNFNIVKYNAWDFTNNNARNDSEYNKFDKVMTKLINNLQKEVDKNKLSGKIECYGDWDDGPIVFVLSESYIEEGFLKSEPDILYNKEAFDNGDINICFVIGHSGSGKSTLAHGKESDIIEVYELDDLQCIKDSYTMDNLKEYGDLIYSFFNGPGKKFYITYNELVEQNIPGSEYEDKLYKEFVAYAINYAKKHKDKKYILEGVWIFCYDEKGKPYFEPSYFKDYAFYIKGTSAIKSKYRAALRDSKYDGSLEPKYKGFKRLKGFTKQFFTKNWKWYKLDEKRINKFREYFKNKPETVLSETKDASVIEDDFKKKSGKSFKLIDLNTQEALKYVSDKWRNGKECRLAICKEDDKLAGYIYWNKSGTIAPMEVYKDYRGYGLSETLMKEAIKNGGNKLGVYSDNEVAIRLYKKLGFVEAGRKKYKDGDEVIIMELKSSLNEAYSNELGKIQKDPEIIDSYGFISSNGIYNENVKIKGFNKWLRGRSELLILDGDKLYLKKDPKKGYSIPGGGWEKGEDHNLSAIRETNEEARIKVKNVNYVSSYVAYFPPKDWVKERISEENWWYGEYIELYIGEYDGQYKGKVEKIDQDKAMESGKFYDIKSIYNDLIPVHQEALSDIINEASISNYKFLDIKSNKSKALEYLKANSETKSYAEDTIKNYNGELVIYNDTMIGRILIGDKKDKGFITDFYIDEDYRGNKLGSKLIDDAINKYHGIDLLVDKDNKLAIDMYKRRGFVVIKTIKNQYWMKLESKLKEDTNMMNEAMNALLTGYIPGSVDNPNNTYIVNYMQNNVFSGEDPNEGIGVSDNLKLTNLIIRDSNGILKRVDESFLDDKTYKVYIIELSVEEVSNRLSKYMGESVEEGFIYETLTGNKLYTKDQIQFESKLTPVMDYYESMDTFKEICDNYFQAKDKKEESINESSFIPKEVRYFNNSGLMYSDKVYTMEGYINSKPNKVLEALDISIN